MARLDGTNGQFLELTPVAYWREVITPPPDAGQVLETGVDEYGNRWQRVRWTPNDLDANWLVVHMAASNGRRWWDETASGFMTWDLWNLVAWMRRLAEGRKTGRTWDGWWSADYEVEMEATGSGDDAVLTVMLGGWVIVQDVRRGENLPEQEYNPASAPGIAGMYRFADELEAEMQPFPVRIVKPDGLAHEMMQRLENERAR